MVAQATRKRRVTVRVKLLAVWSVDSGGCRAKLVELFDRDAILGDFAELALGCKHGACQQGSRIGVVAASSGAGQHLAPVFPVRYRSRANPDAAPSLRPHVVISGPRESHPG
jgi:hypothetical protein